MNASSGPWFASFETVTPMYRASPESFHSLSLGQWSRRPRRLSICTRSRVRRPKSRWVWRNWAIPSAASSVLTFAVTKSRSRNSASESTRPNSRSIASVRTEVSTTRPPCSRRIRSSLTIGPVPSSGMASTDALEPKPTTGSRSPVPGIGRVGRSSWPVSRPESTAPARRPPGGAAKTAPRPASRRRKLRRSTLPAPFNGAPYGSAKVKSDPLAATLMYCRPSTL